MTKTTNCGRCEGTGSAGWSYEGPNQVDNGECSRCNGTGLVRDYGEDSDDLATTATLPAFSMADLVNERAA